MPLMYVRFSSASAEQIPDGTGARVRVMWNDGTKVDMRADLTDEEVAKFLPWATPVVPRPERGPRKDDRRHR